MEWGSWELFGECSDPCGGGEKTRTRECENRSNPVDENCEEECEGGDDAASETVECNPHCCNRMYQYCLSYLSYLLMITKNVDMYNRSPRNPTDIE